MLALSNQCIHHFGRTANSSTRCQNLFQRFSSVFRDPPKCCSHCKYSRLCNIKLVWSLPLLRLRKPLISSSHTYTLTHDIKTSLVLSRSYKWPYERRISQLPCHHLHPPCHHSHPPCQHLHPPHMPRWFSTLLNIFFGATCVRQLYQIYLPTLPCLT